MKRILFILSVVLWSCSEEGPERTNFSIVKSPLEIEIHGSGEKMKQGEELTINASSSKADLVIEQVQVFVNDSLIHQSDKLPLQTFFSSSNIELGRNQIKISVQTNEKVESKSESFILHASGPPMKYTYEVIHSYPHDEKAYTQGLVYHNGYLYEGTGQKSQSQLRKIDYKTGNVLESRPLENKFFGEGVAVLKDKIYQMTWQAKTGFIYNLDNMEETGRFYYQGEGWGLTTDGEYFYRTDGSEKIYLHKVSAFEHVKTIHVYSDQKAINWLNEIEYVGGKIYANIWQSDDIGIIDPTTGKLEGIINFKGLLPKKERKEETDVLNGIAYDEKNDRFFVTGKYWPKLYEVRIMPSS